MPQTKSFELGDDVVSALAFLAKAKGDDPEMYLNEQVAALLRANLDAADKLRFELVQKVMSEGKEPGEVVSALKNLLGK